MMNYIPLPDVLTEMIEKLMDMDNIPYVPRTRKARGWHPYIYTLFLSEKPESNVLMLTILLFILKDSHPYFLEFMGETEENYISQRNKKTGFAIVRRMKKEQLESMDGMTMWDAFQQFIE